MARHQQCQQVAALALERAMRLVDRLLLALVRAGGEPERASRDLRREFREFALARRQRRRRGLEVADAKRAPGAELAQPLGLHHVLGEAEVESADHRPDQARPAPPALE